MGAYEDDEKINYTQLIRDTHISKRLGQNFLINKEIARLEAQFANGKNAIEIGPGLGILTKELCRVAKQVISLEIDKKIYDRIKDLTAFTNLTLINSDFFKVSDDIFDRSDILVSNIPYNLSSKIIEWLSRKKIEAIVCVQKEFASHMMGNQSTREYSKLSVIAALSFNIKKIRDVSPQCFYPRPRVYSSIIHITPKANQIKEQESRIISLLMEHKKKKIRNCIIDSRKALNITKEEAMQISDQTTAKDQRPLHMNPNDILLSASEISILLSKSRKSNKDLASV